MGKPNLTDKKERGRQYRRRMLWSAIVIVAGAMLAPLAWYALAPIPTAQAQAQAQDDNNPRANYWRAVRGGDAGWIAEVEYGITLAAHQHALMI